MHSKHLVHLLKYQDPQEAGLAMARMMVGAGRNLLLETDVIITRATACANDFGSGASTKLRSSRCRYRKASGKPWLLTCCCVSAPTSQPSGT